MAAPITSNGLIKWFRECGFPMPPEHKVCRIVIDADSKAKGGNEVVKVYVEMYGTTEMLNVKPPEFAPAQITIVGKKEEEYDSWGQSLAERGE